MAFQECVYWHWRWVHSDLSVWGIEQVPATRERTARDWRAGLATITQHVELDKENQKVNFLSIHADQRWSHENLLGSIMYRAVANHQG